ncbi:hypothetical protein BaRGS_00032763 [Batillaria attramentaria]|uniref:Carbohydrate sulfotransferase n=1 Tax=Batillaria attramentaria TaxID=370345 RepID=A0ABD0JMS4_9CAEN
MTIFNLSVKQIDPTHYSKSSLDDADSKLIVVAVEYDDLDEGFLAKYDDEDDDKDILVPKHTSKSLPSAWARDALPATTVASTGFSDTLPNQILARFWDISTAAETALEVKPNLEWLTKMLHAEKDNVLSAPAGLKDTVLSTMPASTSKVDDWAVVQRTRKKLLRRKCEEYNLLPRLSPYNTRSIVHEHRNFLYCPVEKAASTFMRRFMYSIHSTNSSRILSPFEIPIQIALKYEFDTLRSMFRRGTYNFVDNSTKFLLVRDPYARLFASFVDKLSVPNNYYWKAWAVPAISHFRKSPSAQSLNCGHDVTFVEFVKYVIQSLHERDEHLRPVRDLCAPCDVEFSLIGHLETLNEDFQLLTSVLNVSITNFNFETLAEDVAEDSIRDATYSTFEFYLDLRECLSKFEMGQRLWKQMQVKGIIDDEFDFPLSREEMDKMTAGYYVHLLENARKLSRDHEKLRQQKQNAIRAAFEQVSAQDILKIVDIYSLDFEMFGYDKFPEFIVKTTGPVGT